MASLVESISKYGEVEMALAQSKLQSYDYSQDMKDMVEKQQAKNMSSGNEFISQLLASSIPSRVGK